MNINKFVRLEEVKHDLSRAEVARRMKVSPQTLSQRLVRGTLRVNDLEKIAHAMDCDLEVKFIDCK